MLLGTSYALFSEAFIGKKNYSLSSGNLKVYLDESRTNNISLTNVVPVSDEDGMKNEPFVFSLVNEEKQDLEYTIYLKEEEFENKTPSSAIRYNYKRDIENIRVTRNIEEQQTDEGAYYLESGIIPANTTYNYELRVWIDLNAGNEIMGTEYSMKIEIESSQTVNPIYKEEILNGTDPILTENLVPVIIEDDGTVRKASLYKEWYNYSNQRWANAVVLENNKIDYSVDEVIPDENIESYFVWIPKYSYQLWDLGNYTTMTTIDSNKIHAIPIRFGLENTNDSNDGECTTPTSVGASGSCKIGDYMTHPAFLAFDSTGFWAGKFESGYKGATTTTEAQINNAESDNLMIKPNVYSWRNITLGNAFAVSYNYLRKDNSHMMKNTEWGCVAYLQHSEYGSHINVRFNNNSSFLTGYASTVEPTCAFTTNEVNSACNKYGTTSDITQPYNTEIGYLASTTGNITGIYDMSGGSTEEVAAYNIVFTNNTSSGILTIYEDFFTNSKWYVYYDRYYVNSNSTSVYNQRILGDAIGELGPFGYKKDADGVNRYKSSWYQSHSFFMANVDRYAFLFRGGTCRQGIAGTLFSFSPSNGGKLSTASFRIVLTP